MNTKKYIVRLAVEERQQLETVVKKLEGISQKVKRDIALLKTDADGPNWTNKQIHERTGLTVQTIVNRSKRLSIFVNDLSSKVSTPPLTVKNDGCRPF